MSGGERILPTPEEKIRELNRLCDVAQRLSGYLPSGESSGDHSSGGNQVDLEGILSPLSPEVQQFTEEFLKKQGPTGYSPGHGPEDTISGESEDAGIGHQAAVSREADTSEIESQLDASNSLDSRPPDGMMSVPESVFSEMSHRVLVLSEEVSDARTTREEFLLQLDTERAAKETALALALTQTEKFDQTILVYERRREADAAKIRRLNLLNKKNDITIRQLKRQVKKGREEAKLDKEDALRQLTEERDAREAALTLALEEAEAERDDALRRLDTVSDERDLVLEEAESQADILDLSRIGYERLHQADTEEIGHLKAELEESNTHRRNLVAFITSQLLARNAPSPATFDGEQAEESLAEILRPKARRERTFRQRLQEKAIGAAAVLGAGVATVMLAGATTTASPESMHNPVKTAPAKPSIAMGHHARTTTRTISFTPRGSAQARTVFVDRGHGITHEIMDLAEEQGHSITPTQSGELFNQLEVKFGNKIIDLAGPRDTYRDEGELRLARSGHARWFPGVKQKLSLLLQRL